ncbi:hypothetical protein ACVILI_000489 [Mesorhizobium sp. USDA 4775]
MLEEIDAEFNWTDAPRGLSEILEAERLLERQIWYNRHQNLRIGIERGNEKIVTNEEWSVAEPRHRQNMTTAGTWRIAQDSARRTEEEIGTDKLGPWTNFEWGMLNGKLSALRWVMGDEWDMLDT